MITTYEEYNSSLHLVNNANPPIYAMLPSAENIYNIDASTREVDAPKFLSVEKDHKSETVYFIVDRYVDYMDLATTCCAITYTNVTAGISRIYHVPFYDIYTYADERKMLLPWCLDANVAAKRGKVEFAIQFYKVGEAPDEENGGTKKVLTYSLNTIPAKSEVRAGMEIKQMDSSYLLNASQYQDLDNRLKVLEDPIKAVYWTILD